MKDIKKFFKSPLGKVILEALRWGVFSFFAAVISRLSALVPGLEGQVDVVKLTAALRFLDLILHKSEFAIKGISVIDHIV